MRVLVVGASGRLGTAVVAAFTDPREVVAASRSGEHYVDLASSVGEVDAVVCAAGRTPYGRLAELTSAQWPAGVRDKLLGQVEPAATPVPVADAPRAYVESVEGDSTDQVFRVGY